MLGRARGILLATAALALLAIAPARGATTITVDTAADTYGQTDTHCSLRDAVQAVDTQAAFGTCPAGTGNDTIVLPASIPTYTLSLAPSGPDDNSTGDLNITRSVTITGAGASTTTIDAAHLDRIFDISDSNTVTISGLTLTHGHAPDGTAGVSGTTPTAGGPGADGGAILNGSGSLSLLNVTIENSTAGAGGGGGSNTSFGSGAHGGSGGNGGAVASAGPLSLQNVNLTSDTAGAGGAGGSGVLPGFGGSGGTGGAIDVAGSLTVSGGAFSADTAGAGSSGGGGGSGGAIGAGSTLSVTNATFSNDAAGAGSAAFLAVGGAGGGAGGAISVDGTATVSQSTFSGNTTGASPSASAPQPSGAGGAILANAALTLTGDSFTQNSTASGGLGNSGGSGSGGAVQARGGLQVSASTFSSNSTGSGGHGSGNGPASGAGGAIFSSQQANITKTTFTGNTTGAGGVANGSSSTGGASGNGGAIASDSTLMLAGSTLSANSVGAGGTGSTAGTPGSGAAVWVTQGTGSQFVNDTLTANGTRGVDSGAAAFFTGTTTVTLAAITDAANASPGVAEAGTATVTLAGTLLAANTPANCAGPITDGGHNLAFGTAGTCPGTFASGDPKLAPLRGNGGPTQTMALLAGSAAIDAGPKAPGAGCPTVDQRGIPRPQGGACDIGAYEYAVPKITITAPANRSSYRKGQVVKAAYSCTEGGIAGFVATCHGSVPNGSRIDTSTPGRHTFTVTSTDVAGDFSELQVSYTVIGPTHRLLIVFQGRGHGAVVLLGRLRCTKTCSHTFPAGTKVTLKVKPAAGSKFAGFGGACHGRQSCTVTLSANRRVTVTFALKRRRRG